jgi:hypothetical protein
MKESDLKRLHASSHSYRKAAIMLLNSKDPSLFLPATVNQALALELSLKCLCYIDQKVKLPTHSHKKLFIQLNQKLKKEMIDDFSKFIAEESTQKQLSALEHAAKMDMPRDLMNALKAWGEIFVNARYEHELEGKKLSMMFFDKLFNMVIKEIKHRKPQW